MFVIYSKNILNIYLNEYICLDVFKEYREQMFNYFAGVLFIVHVIKLHPSIVPREKIVLALLFLQAIIKVVNLRRVI